MAATVRVEDDVHATLRELARDEHRSISRVIQDAVVQYKREKFWRDVKASVERLLADPIAWKDYQDEIMLLEGGSMDGLDNEEPYDSADEVAEIRGRQHAATIVDPT